MAVPDFQSFFKPLLDLAADGNEHSIQDARVAISARMSLPDHDMQELLPSGTQTKFDNRVAWAKSYFIQARVLEASRRAHFKITQRGIDLHRKGNHGVGLTYRILASFCLGELLALKLRAQHTSSKTQPNKRRNRPQRISVSRAIAAC